MASDAAKKQAPWLRALPGGRQAATPAGSPAQPSDDELIDAVVRGDDRVASLIYDRVVGAIDRTLVRVFGRREHDHDDLVQTCFEQIIVTIARQRFARACSLPTWAATVATNVGLNALRSRRRERRVVDRDCDVAAVDQARGRDGGERVAVARLELERVRGHLSAMDPAKAQTLFLHDALGHDLAEVAVLTGASVAAAQSRLVRARKDLMARLERDASQNGGGK